MKVLQILPELNAGGVERGTVEMAQHLVRAGHAAVVVSHGGEQVAALTASGARHITLPVHRKHLSSFFQVGPLRRLLEREQPDILHIRSRVPGWIAWWAWRKMPPQTRPRLVSTVHGFYSINPYSAIMTRGERVIAVSESIRQYIAENFPKTPLKYVRVIPRGIAPEVYPRGFQPDPAWQQQWLREFPQLAGQRLLTLPGRISRLKGHEDFLRLIQELVGAGEKFHGLIVGGAHPKKQGYFQEMQTLATRLGVAHQVTFTGHRSDLREILAASAVVFSLSAQPEAFGRTTLEALALGRPVIGYDHGGVGELLRQFFPTGGIPLRDAQALLRSTRAMLAAAPAPAPVGAPFTVDAMCRSTLRVYEELAPPAQTKP